MALRDQQSGASASVLKVTKSKKVEPRDLNQRAPRDFFFFENSKENELRAGFEPAPKGEFFKILVL